jgi:hypothetical protein
MHSRVAAHWRTRALVRIRQRRDDLLHWLKGRWQRLRKCACLFFGGKVGVNTNNGVSHRTQQNNILSGRTHTPRFAF